MTVKAGRIEAVKVTPGFERPEDRAAQDALKTIPERIVEKQSAAVEPAAGAEAVSRAICRAVGAALDSAVPWTLPGAKK